jgi:hypothetical protein
MFGGRNDAHYALAPRPCRLIQGLHDDKRDPAKRRVFWRLPGGTGRFANTLVVAWRKNMKNNGGFGDFRRWLTCLKLGAEKYEKRRLGLKFQVH